MTFGFLAGRSTIRTLHRTVERNVLRQHRRNHARYESSHPSPSSPSTRKASNVAANNGADAAARITGTGWAWMEPLKTPFRAYGNMQARSPLLTQWETTLVIYFLGDLSAQSVQSNGFEEVPYEPIRGLRSLIIAGIISIPAYKSFMWLGRSFNYSSKVLSLGAKILFSQMVISPAMSTYFFGMHGLLSGATLPQAWERVCMTMPVSWMNSWKIFPAVTAFTFTFVQPQYRAVFTGVIAVFWQTYLSFLNRNAEHALTQAETIETTETRKSLATA